MKLREEFTIDERLEDVWAFLQQAERVAACMPGMESVDVIDDDNVVVRISQRVGPMSATFEAKVKVLERVEQQSIRFEAIGKSIRGSAGSLRTLNAVTLRPAGDGTAVVVDGDVALAGPLGSVGQKVVAKQADKVTQQFVVNLRAGMSGSTAAGQSAPVPGEPGARSGAAPVRATAGPVRTTGSAGVGVQVGESPSRGVVELGSLPWWMAADIALRAASLVVWVLALRRALRTLDRMGR